MTSKERNPLGVFLEELRGKTPLREVAAKCGLSHTYIRDLELGINRKTKAPINPTPDTLMRLSEAYKFPYEELMRMAGYLSEDDKEGKDKKEKTPVEKLIEYLELELTDEEIIERMTFKIDNMTLDDEDVREFIAFVRAKRSMKKSQPAGSSKNDKL